MKTETSVCSGCCKPIDARRGFDFVCFKVPGTTDYRLFHREPCWQDYLKEKKP
ncbi:MAG TPA: hypothetical protein VLC94_09120 [Candidatus Acidoferrum sp.]|nr:hypothetical protein [Candidatus Acidoferrum sp.]